MIEWLVLGGGVCVMLFFGIFRPSWRDGVKIRDERYLHARKSGATHDQANEYARQEVMKEVNARGRALQDSLQDRQLESEALRYYERKNREGS